MAKLYQGYIVLLATFICRFVGMGLYYSGGLFIIPVSVTFGVGNALAALNVAIYSSVSYVASLLSGYLQDKLVARGFSVRPIFGLGAILLFAATFAASLCNSFALFLLCAILMGVGIGFTCYSAPGVLSLWFEKNRSRNLLLAMSGGGIGSLVYAQVIVLMMSEFHKGEEDCSIGGQNPMACAEWRPTLRYVGTCSAVMLLLASFFMRDPTLEDVEAFEGRSFETQITKSDMPRQDRYASQGESKNHRDRKPLEKSESMFIATGAYDSDQLSFKEVIQTKTSILLCLWALSMAIVLDGYFIFVPSYAEDIGLSSKQGGLIVFIAALALLIGNLTLGFVVDILGNIRTFQLCTIGLTISVFAWPFCKSLGSLLIVSFGVGFCTVSTSLYISILADVYGNVAKNCFFSVIGLIQSLEAPGVLFGPVIIGMLIDKSGYYAGAFFCAGVFVLSVVTVLALPSKENQLQKIYESKQTTATSKSTRTVSSATTLFPAKGPDELPKTDKKSASTLINEDAKIRVGDVSLTGSIPVMQNSISQNHNKEGADLDKSIHFTEDI